MACEERLAVVYTLMGNIGYVSAIKYSVFIAHISKLAKAE